MDKKLNEALELQGRFSDLIRREREVLNEILDLIIEADSKRSYLELGFPSLFAWLVGHFKYSESSAKRRIDCARLKKSVPAVEDKIENGALNLTTISKAQSAIRAEEIRTHTRMTDTEKAQVIEKIEGKSGPEIEKILMAEFPEAQIFQKETVRAISENETSVVIVMSNAEFEEFKRARELLSHTIPTGSAGKIFAMLCREFNQRKDPLKKMPRADSGATAGKEKVVGPDAHPAPSSLDSRHIPNAIRLAVLQRDSRSCQARSPIDGKLCGSTYQVEVDHIQPWATGGQHTVENLRCLCSQHNRHRAEKTFGKRRRS